MPRHLIILMIVLNLITACAPAATPERPARPTETLRIPDDVPTPPGCGDGICRPPNENPFTCREDCPIPTDAPAAPPTPVKPTRPAPVKPTLTPLPAPTATADAPQPVTLQRPIKPQIGLNFIRFYWSNRANEIDTTTPYLQPDTIWRDFGALGAQTYRQFVKADLFWDVIEPRDNDWNFAQADSVIPNANFEPIVTLFRMQYASPTPPWATSPAEFQRTIGPEATDYLATVVQRYAPFVKYWEIGNELGHWRAADPGSTKAAPGAEKAPAYVPPDGYAPAEQGVFLAQAAALIRQYDPEAVILMPGLPSLDEYSLKTWLPAVIESGGRDWFDIVNYHYYEDWERFPLLRPQFQAALQRLKIDDKPVWLTETGSSWNAANTAFTDYPNSPESQAADIFRRVVQAWGHGDQLAEWHTYISSYDEDGMWSAYGIRSQTGQPQLSYVAFQLLTSELVPFERVEKIAADGRSENIYQVTTSAGEVKYVVWGKGTFTVPNGVTIHTSVIPPQSGTYVWGAIKAGDKVTLSPNPILLK